MSGTSTATSRDPRVILRDTAAVLDEHGRQPQLRHPFHTVQPLIDNLPATLDAMMAYLGLTKLHDVLRTDGLGGAAWAPDGLDRLFMLPAQLPTACLKPPVEFVNFDPANETCPLVTLGTGSTPMQWVWAGPDLFGAQFKMQRRDGNTYQALGITVHTSHSRVVMHGWRDTNPRSAVLLVDSGSTPPVHRLTMPLTGMVGRIGDNLRRHSLAVHLTDVRRKALKAASGSTRRSGR